MELAGVASNLQAQILRELHYGWTFLSFFFQIALLSLLWEDMHACTTSTITHLAWLVYSGRQQFYWYIICFSSASFHCSSENSSDVATALIPRSEIVDNWLIAKLTTWVTCMHLVVISFVERRGYKNPRQGIWWGIFVTVTIDHV